MRTFIKHTALVALAALALSGCASVDFVASPTSAFGYNTSLGLVTPKLGSSSGDVVGGGPTQVATGTTRALYQTTVGPIALKGSKLAMITSSGAISLWDAPDSGFDAALSISSDSLGWAVGTGVERYANGTWTPETTDVDAWLPTSMPLSQRIVLTDVAFATGSSTIGFAVGTRGTVLQYQSSTKHWAKADLPATAASKNFGTVKVVSSTEAWVAGDAVYHWVNGAWTQTPVPGSVTGLAVAGDAVWASTGNGLYQWVNGNWTLAFSPAAGSYAGAPQLYAATSGVIGMAIDAGVPSGAIFTLSNGHWSTETVTLPSAVGLDSLVIADAHTAYAKADDNSGVWKYDLDQKTWSLYSQ